MLPVWPGNTCVTRRVRCARALLLGNLSFFLLGSASNVCQCSNAQKVLPKVAKHQHQRQRNTKTKTHQTPTPIHQHDTTPMANHNQGPGDRDTLRAQCPRPDTPHTTHHTTPNTPNAQTQCGPHTHSHSHSPQSQLTASSPLLCALRSTICHLSTRTRVWAVLP